MHCLSVGSSQKRAKPLSKLPHPIAVFTDISSTKERNSGSWDHWCAAQQQHLVNVQKYGNLGPVFTNSVCHQNEKYCNGRGWAADILLEIWAYSSTDWPSMAGNILPRIWGTSLFPATWSMHCRMLHCIADRKAEQNRADQCDRSDCILHNSAKYGSVFR